MNQPNRTYEVWEYNCRCMECGGRIALLTDKEISASAEFVCSVCEKAERKAEELASE